MNVGSLIRFVVGTAAFLLIMTGVILFAAELIGRHRDDWS